MKLRKKLKTKSKSNRTNLIITLMFILITLFMTTGFASFGQTLNFSGKATLAAVGQIYISDVTKVDSEFVNASGSIKSYSGTQAVLPVTASSTSFTATYLVTVTSTYTKDVAFAGIKLTPSLSGMTSVDTSVDVYEYSTGNPFYPGDTLKASSDTVLKVVIHYTADSTGSSDTLLEIEQTSNTSGTLLKGDLDRTTGAFDDNKTPECYNVTFTNSYSYDNVVSISSSTAGYKVVNSRGNALGNVTVPANSTSNVNYCVMPTTDVENGAASVDIAYNSLSSGESFSDTIVFTLSTKKVILAMSTNFDDGMIICNDLTTAVNGIIGTTKSGNASVMIGDEVECSVGDGDALASNKEYQYVDGSTVSEYYYNKWTITSDSSSYTKYIELSWKDPLSGTFANANQSTALTGTMTNKRSGYYLIEMWGGNGGKGSSVSGWVTVTGGSGGTGGYVYGAVYLAYDQTIYYSLGGNGKDNTSNTSGASGGANGGGSSSSAVNSSGSGGGGGGYSILNLDNSSGTVVAVAGGAGGGSGRGGNNGIYNGSAGGNGGGNSTTATSISTGTVFAGTDGTSRGSTYYGTGGSTTAGYCPSHTSGTYGASLTGGTGYKNGGGGGAGYFGGGGGASPSSFNFGNMTYVGGGGGGSSFLNSSVTYSGLSSTVTSKLVGTNPSSTGGGFIISYIGKTLN